MSEQNPMLQVTDLYKSYGDKVILDNIDLTVKRGELVTVVGPSGCGKSTMLRMILGQEAPSVGEMLIDGKPVGLPDKSRGIVYQNYSLFPNLTVMENVIRFHTLSHNPITARLKRKEFEALGMEYLTKVRLQDHANKYPSELSGGMRQRVAIAQAMMAKPKILLMDEPFGALDQGTREDLQMFLIELWLQEQMTVFFVTHQIDEAIYLGSRLVLLSQYYTDDRGSTAHDRGAKIVMDMDLSHISLNSGSRMQQEVVQLEEQILEKGFDPNFLQHVRDFDLSHGDSWQTLTDQEHSNN